MFKVLNAQSYGIATLCCITEVLSAAVLAIISYVSSLVAYLQRCCRINGANATEKFVPEVDEHILTTRDGVRLRYYVAFASGGRKPLMMMCPHLRQYRVKGGFSTGTLIMIAFKNEYTFVTWEQRGNIGSTEPADPTHIGIDYDAQDGMEVMKAAGYAKAAVLFGHSQGVQIGLEMVCQAPTCVEKLILSNGAHGRTFDYICQVVPIPGMSSLCRRLFHFMYQEDWVVELFAFITHLTRPIVLPMWRLSFRAVADKRVPDTVNMHMEFAETFFVEDATAGKSLLRWVIKLDEHCTRSRLHTVKQPVLLLSGRWDWLTPCRVMFDMARLLPNCTHYCGRMSGHSNLTTHWTENIKVMKDFLENS